MSEINYYEIVKELYEISDRFNDWELKFICDMYNNGPYGFSEKEKSCILKMNKKYRKHN
jgi:hypothetical protein